MKPGVLAQLTDGRWAKEQHLELIKFRPWGVRWEVLR
jgi:hypothetical protein